MINKRAFIIGCPRSGTTLLQAILNAHTEITSFPESHFFNVLKNPSRIRHWFTLSNKQEIDALLLKYAKDIGYPDNVDKKTLEKARTYRDYIEIFANLLDGVAESRGAAIWIEKTPRHLHNVKLISHYFKNPLFIHLIRDGLSTIASLYKVTHENPEVWGGKRSIEDCTNRWLFDINEHQEYIGKKNHFFCTYDDIINHKELTAESICTFFDITFDSSMVRDFSSSFDQIVEGSESWKSNVKGPIENTSNVQNVLSESQISSVKNRIATVDISKFRISNRKEE